MKTRWLAMIFLILALGGCITIQVGASSPTQSETAPVMEAPQIITSQPAAGFQRAASIQASSSPLLCKWATDSRSFWVYDAKSAQLFDTDSLSPIAEFDGAGDKMVYDVSPDGKTLAYSPDGQELRLFDVSAKTEKMSIQPGFYFSDAMFSADGRELGVVSMDEIKVFQYSVSSGEQSGVLSGFQTAAPVYSVKYSPDGNTLMWLSRGTVQPMDISSGKMGPVLGHEDFVMSLAMSADASSIATAAAGTLNGEFQPLVTLWNTASGDARWQIGDPTSFGSLDFSPDGSLLAAGSQSDVIIYEVPTGNELVRLQTGSDTINSLKFAPDNSALLVCGIDGNVSLWKPD